MAFTMNGHAILSGEEEELLKTVLPSEQAAAFFSSWRARCWNGHSYEMNDVVTRVITDRLLDGTLKYGNFGLGKKPPSLHSQWPGAYKENDEPRSPRECDEYFQEQVRAALKKVTT